ncbi:DHA2 family efflux MFS transporter permease subunit [Thermodesulfobacteriota bacterium]
MDSPAERIDSKHRAMIIFSALLALFLGALDALIMTAAMPTIVAELGGLHLYSWVYSAYLLARAVSLPVFGKLGDLFKNKHIFLVSIAIFLLSSATAGFSPNMAFLIACRVFQGIGAGGIFAMVYIVLADISPPGQRTKTMSFASSVWGIASVLGPTMGGFIVSYMSWRWIFFINVPLGLLSLGGISFFLVEIREKRRKVSLDLLGVLTLSVSIVGFLSLFLSGGKDFAWGSPQVMALLLVTILAGIGFFYCEKHAEDPIISMEFFKKRGFAIGNASVFMSSFAIFAFFAFAPIFIQGAQGKSPMQVGIAMLSLSLGWSIGSIIFGQISHRLGAKTAAIMGAMFLVAGCGFSLTFHTGTSMIFSFLVFQLVGLGMGFVALATLVIVQNAVDPSDLGVATASHQFMRTFGGTVGIGICGGLLMSRLTATIDNLADKNVMGILPEGLLNQSQRSFENLLRPEFQALLPEAVRRLLQSSIASSVQFVFWVALFISLLCLAICFLLPDSRAE